MSSKYMLNLIMIFDEVKNVTVWYHVPATSSMFQKQGSLVCIDM